LHQLTHRGHGTAHYGDEFLARDAAHRFRRFGFSLGAQKIEQARTSVRPKKLG
jgi:hypothetical protein